MARKSGMKRQIRKAIYSGGRAMWIDPDDVNALTNTLWKRVVRPALAKAFAEGFKYGQEYPGSCKGRDCHHVNPYDGSRIQ